MKLAIFLKVAYFLIISIVFLFINKTLWLNNVKARTNMNWKILISFICVKAIMYLLLHNLHDWTFKRMQIY